ncbi:phosphosulfolactate synthase [Longirhabdus pacifica]|uniref:phosphosulfolactate synthase n=1 Tax=Longirhabdus pacifica TaxID=2305227 RepID=UPI0013E8AEF4|nr:phosphosulfolactate synthase [Longirhabdus pacifica]
MKDFPKLTWHNVIEDPSKERNENSTSHRGVTMVIDKGVPLQYFIDYLILCSKYIDVIKLGFGTSALYPIDILKEKIKVAKQFDITIVPGGTFMEVAILHNKVDTYLATCEQYGFNGIEISDGTISLSVKERNALIKKAIRPHWKVITEYGKKIWGSSLQVDAFIDTVQSDLTAGSSFVIIEGRETGKGVGIYDDEGKADQEKLHLVEKKLGSMNHIMWEAPLKSQQVFFIQSYGANVNLGNICYDDVLALEWIVNRKLDNFFKVS